jgi:hypothetical protein
MIRPPTAGQRGRKRAHSNKIIAELRLGRLIKIRTRPLLDSHAVTTRQTG